MSDAPAAVVDVAFLLQGQTLALAREHRQALAAALTQALPWLASLAGAGVHRLNVSAGGGAMALLSQRTRLTLRLPRALWPIPQAFGHVMAFTEDGKVVADLQDPTGQYPETTGVTETPERLYIQSLHAKGLGWMGK